MMVGAGQEEPEVVQTLLDLEQTPSKPQYRLASDEPLLLYSVTHEGLQFRRSRKVYAEVLRGIETVVTRSVG